jgi:hypothetical protein
MQANAGPFPRADETPTQPQGRPGKYCEASTHERSMREVEMEGVGAERPFWCQLCTGSASPRADGAPTQPQGRSWKHCVASAHGRSTPGSENGRLGRRGHSEAKIALAVPAWHRTVHRTVLYRLDGKIRSLKFGNTPSFTKRRSVPYSLYRTV